MPDWKVNPALDVPPSRQLIEAILDAVASGHLKAGAQLPSVRRMAAEALVNHNTVARAWRELEHLGVVAGENGRGVFVTPEGPQVARERRREHTLAAFDRSLAEALRSGHTLEALLARITLQERDIA